MSKEAVFWILIINLASSFYNIGGIWLMQMLFYPLFGVVGDKEWVKYHREHWKLMKPPVRR